MLSGIVFWINLPEVSFISNIMFEVKWRRAVNESKIEPSVLTVMVQTATTITAKNMAESHNRGPKLFALIKDGS